MATTFADLGEHVGTVVAILGIFAFICATLVGVIYKIALGLKVDIFRMIEKLDERIENIWGEIGFLRQNQSILREALPKEYMRLDGPGYKAMIESLTRIENHFEEFVNFCRSGKCKGAMK